MQNPGLPQCCSSACLPDEKQHRNGAHIQIVTQYPDPKIAIRRTNHPKIKVAHRMKKELSIAIFAHLKYKQSEKGR